MRTYVFRCLKKHRASPKRIGPFICLFARHTLVYHDLVPGEEGSRMGPLLQEASAAGTTQPIRLGEEGELLASGSETL